ncbi:MAG: MATE family efflux transporter, partial [Bacteroidaceae bacterium]|nr:MATE family efflux transporter [Bacteroidaceae bacterium]
SFSSGMTTFAGQNFGAGKMDRVEKGARQGTILALSVSTTITILLLLFSRYLLALFTDTQELIDLGDHMIRIMAVGYIVMAITQSLSGIMNGVGDTWITMITACITMVCVRVPLAYIMVGASRTPENPVGNPDMMYVSLLLSWIFGAILAVIMYIWRSRLAKKRAGSVL